MEKKSYEEKSDNRKRMKWSEWNQVKEKENKKTKIP